MYGNSHKNIEGVNGSTFVHIFQKLASNFINSLTPETFPRILIQMVSKPSWVIDVLSIFRGMALIWLSLGLTEDKWTMVKAMAWCHEATSHYLNQCSPRSVSPDGVNRPQLC